MTFDYLLDTGWAAGLITADGEGTIVSGAPIFKRLIGQNVYDITRKYRVTLLQGDE